MEKNRVDELDKYLNEYEKNRRKIRGIITSASIQLLMIIWSIIRPPEKSGLITVSDLLIIGLILTIVYLFLALNKLKLLRSQIWILASECDPAPNKKIVLSDDLLEEVFQSKPIS